MVQYSVEDFLRDVDKPRNTNVLLGIIFLLLGTIAILLPKLITGLVIYALGTLLVISGIGAMIAALRGKDVANAGVYMGIVLLAVGILIYIFPVAAGHILTFILLLLLLGTGLVFFYWVHIIGLRESGYLPLIGGLLSIFFVIVIVMGWFGDVNPWLIGTFIGIDLLFNGIILLVLGIQRR